MHIERIDIQNFKLFDRRSFEFHPRFNLVVGVNGSGKTSLLKAIAKALSTMMRYVGKEFPLEDRDTRVIRKSTRAGIRFEQNHRTDIFVKISGLLSLRANYKKFRDTHPLPETDDELFISKLANRLRKNIWETLPVILFFPCNRYWSEHDSNPIDAFDAATHKESRLTGYDHWHEASADYKHLQRWIVGKTFEQLQAEFQAIIKSGLVESKETIDTELNVVNKAITSCLENTKGIRYDFIEKSIFVDWITEESSILDDLSHGQRTLLAMVADIARRACLLNPHLGNKVLEETPGIVLIDELDLHLHPKWQRRIIGDLRRTFPQIQFICTTHSPQLIGQCKPEEIILLDTPEEPHPGQSYGMDSNWILRHIQGSDDRDPTIEAKLNAIFEAIEEAEFEQAETEVIKLRAEIGDHPDLVEAEALINRYTRFSAGGEE